MPSSVHILLPVRETGATVTICLQSEKDSGGYAIVFSCRYIYERVSC